MLAQGKKVLTAVEIYKLVLSGQLKKFPVKFWYNNIGEATEIIKYLIDHRLKWSDDDIKRKLTTKVFKDHSLGGMLDIVFNSSVNKAINATYPDRFKPWELMKVNRNYWNVETGISAVKWLIEEKLKWSDDDIKKNLTKKVFQDNRLGGMFAIVFNSSANQAINATYPNRFRQWELIQVPVGYWNIDTAISATRWLIEEKLQWTDDDIKKNLTTKVFKDHSLGGMLAIVFKDSSYKAINMTYPDKFKPWDIMRVPVDYWNIDTAVSSIKWLIEEKLTWTDDDIKQRLTIKVFVENSLGGMLGQVFQKSPYKAINAAYPDRFKPWDFHQVPTNYWNIDTAVSSIKWLIEEKLMWTDDDVKQRLTIKVFVKNSLGGMLGQVFQKSPYKAINAAYPDRFKPWDFIMAPLHYWNMDTAIKATKWLIEEKLMWTDDDIKKKLSVKIFKNNRLGGMLGIVFKDSPYEAINTAYPDRFKPNDFKNKRRKHDLKHCEIGCSV